MSVATVEVFEARLQALGFWVAVHRSPRPEAIPLRALDSGANPFPTVLPRSLHFAFGDGTQTQSFGRFAA
jgi:hypothetical protein